MSVAHIFEALGFAVLGAYLGGAAGVLVPKFTKEPYNFFSFVNEYVFRIKPKGE